MRRKQDHLCTAFSFVSSQSRLTASPRLSSELTTVLELRHMNLEMPYHWPEVSGVRWPRPQLIFQSQYSLLRSQAPPSSTLITYALQPAQGKKNLLPTQGNFKRLTVFSALRVVSSRDAATQPSSVEPPSHMPAKAAMLLGRQEGKTSVQKC